MNIEDEYRKIEHWMKLWKKQKEYQECLLEHYKKFFLRFKALFLYGGGHDAPLLVDFLEDVFLDREVFFIDSNPEKHGKEVYKGIVCYGPEKIVEYNPNTSIVIIATSKYANEINDELCGSPWEVGSNNLLNRWGWNGRVEKNFVELLVNYQGGLKENVKAWMNQRHLLEIINWFDDKESLEIFSARFLFSMTGIPIPPKCSSDVQYFPIAIKSRLSKEEVFLDCGAYIGDTVKMFRNYTGDRFKAIYSFELSDSNFNKLLESNAIKDSRIMIIHSGIGDKNCKIKYCEEEGHESSVTCDFPNESVKDSFAKAGLLHAGRILTVDSLVEDGGIKEPVTFVKMDIEGSELAALRGMKCLIQRDKPKLAICVYHKPEDILEIPSYIHSLVPEYRLFLRHHSNMMTETVLYAYVE